jgi:hypothetical protein
VVLPVHNGGSQHLIAIMQWPCGGHDGPVVAAKWTWQSPGDRQITNTMVVVLSPCGGGFFILFYLFIIIFLSTYI